MGFQAIGAVIALASASMGLASSIQRQQEQQQQRDYQKDMLRRNSAIAEQNAEQAREEGRQAMRDAHDAGRRKRLETALMVGRERAMTAASGAQVEQGSALDLSLDIAERGELDAMGILDQGVRQDYLQRRRAVGYQAQAAGLQSQADAVDLRSGSETLDFLGGALRQGGNYLKTLQRGGGAKL